MGTEQSGNRKYQCSGCGRKLAQFCDFTQREVRDLPWGQYQTIVVIEVHRVRCPDCGVKVVKVPQLPGKAPFSERFEDEVGRRCESAPVRQVARQVVLAASTVRAIELRYLERWDRRRRRSPVHRIGVDQMNCAIMGITMPIRQSQCQNPCGQIARESAQAPLISCLTGNRKLTSL